MKLSPMFYMSLPPDVVTMDICWSVPHESHRGTKHEARAPSQLADALARTETEALRGRDRHQRRLSQSGDS